MSNIWRRCLSGRLKANNLIKKNQNGVSHLIAGEFFEYTAPVGGVTTKVNVGGVWKDVIARSVNVGGVWKNIISVSTNLAGTWKNEV